MTVAMTHATCRIVYECFVEILECQEALRKKESPRPSLVGGIPFSRVIPIHRDDDFTAPTHPLGLFRHSPSRMDCY